MKTVNKPEQTVGWHGISLQVYKDWSIVGFGGDKALGSMRIDSGDDGGAMFGIEIRWSSVKGAQSTSALESRIGPLLKGVVKEAKKNKVTAAPIILAFKDSVHHDRDSSVDFKWTTERAGHGRIFHCTHCGRIVVAQAYGAAGHEFNRQSKTVLDSILCHSDVDGYVTWGLYGLLTAVPVEFELFSQQLMNVYLQLRFQRRNSAEQLIVEQWSLANVQLKGSYLDEWYDLKSVGWTNGVNAEKAESSVHDHAALSVTGRRSQFIPMMLESVRQCTRLKAPALNYSCIAWECAESNKAYMIQAFTKKPGSKLVADCGNRTVCHEAHVTDRGLDV